jgi:UDP-glucose 4-epimerase
MVLITGGFGYLGGRIAEYLRKSGYRVRIGSSRSIIESNESHSSYQVVQLDLFSNKSLETACKDVSIVIHLAALNAQLCEQDPEKASQINTEGTCNLINSAIKQKVNQFIYFSTAHVYGSSLDGKLTEDTLPSPQHPYASTHYQAEEYVLNASKNQLINGVVLRLSNAIGTPLHKNVNCWMLVTNDLCKQVVTKKLMTIKSNSLLERDFISISEVCIVIDKIINNLNLKNGIFNLSSGVSLTLLDLANLIRERSSRILKYSPRIEFLYKEKTLNTNNKSLVISNNKLKKHGVDINQDIANEIDGLLINCKNWFL